MSCVNRLSCCWCESDFTDNDWYYLCAKCLDYPLCDTCNATLNTFNVVDLNQVQCKRGTPGKHDWQNDRDWYRTHGTYMQQRADGKWAPTEGAAKVTLTMAKKRLKLLIAKANKAPHPEAYTSQINAQKSKENEADENFRFVMETKQKKEENTRHLRAKRRREEQQALSAEGESEEEDEEEESDEEEDSADEEGSSGGSAGGEERKEGAEQDGRDKRAHAADTAAAAAAAPSRSISIVSSHSPARKKARTMERPAAGAAARTHAPSSSSSPSAPRSGSVPLANLSNSLEAALRQHQPPIPSEVCAAVGAEVRSKQLQGHEHQLPAWVKKVATWSKVNESLCTILTDIVKSIREEEVVAEPALTSKEAELMRLRQELQRHPDDLDD